VIQDEFVEACRYLCSSCPRRDSVLCRSLFRLQRISQSEPVADRRRGARLWDRDHADEGGSGISWCSKTGMVSIGCGTRRCENVPKSTLA